MKEILPLMTTWMDLEDSMLNVISQTKKQVLYDLTYMWNQKESELTDQESRLVVARGQGGAGGRSV